jgi:hypothetical protein
MQLKVLEEKNMKLLEWEETKWRMKSKVIWSIKGDESTQFFHNYEKYRKNVHTIWGMRKGNGTQIKRFQEIAKLSVTHFTSFPQAFTNKHKINNKMASYFLRFIYQYQNEDIIVEVFKEELKAMLESFQKSKY